MITDDVFTVRDMMEDVNPAQIPPAGRHAKEVAAMLTLANDRRAGRSERLQHIWLGAAAKALPPNMHHEPEAEDQEAEHLIRMAMYMSDQVDDLLRRAHKIISNNSAKNKKAEG